MGSSQKSGPGLGSRFDPREGGGQEVADDLIAERVALLDGFATW